MEKVITSAHSCHWLRITLLIVQMQQKDRRRSDAGINEGCRGGREGELSNAHKWTVADKTEQGVTTKYGSNAAK